MTDLSGTAAPPATTTAAHEDRTLPAVVYGLYFLGLAYGVTTLIGLVLAYASRGAAGPRMRTHYDFQIRTFWMAIAWALAGGLLMLIGLPLSFVLIGIPIVKLGLAIVSLTFVWIIARCVADAVYLSQDAAYPRPRTWLI